MKRLVYLFLLLLCAVSACKNDTPSAQQTPQWVEDDDINYDSIERARQAAYRDTLEREFDVRVAVPDSENVTLAEFPKCLDFDKIKDLERLFRMLNGACGIVIKEDDGSREEEIFSSVRQIDKYRRGEVKYYPEEAVNDILKTMIFDITWFENHGALMDTRSFFYYYMQLVAYYCPDISYLVDVRTEDYKAGIKYCKHYSNQIFISFLFTERRGGKGCNVQEIGKEVKITAIYKLNDKMGNTYYLCSNHKNEYPFEQFLYFYQSADNISCVAQCEFISINKDNAEIYFNKEQLAWFACRRDEKTDKLIPIEDTPFLTLQLNGEKSQFVE